MKRRTFLKRSLATATTFTVPYFVPSTVLGRPGSPGASETVQVGIIGLGGRARDIAKTCLQIPSMRIRAVCDCFAPRCSQFLQGVGKGQSWNAYEDFREMIDREKLDAVMVETTTHARAWIVIQAMQAGMDVYIEKPMCLTIAEGRRMVQAARKYRRVTQVGTQQRSMPINNWASDLVKNGAIGKIRVVRAPNYVGPEEWPGLPGQELPQGGTKGWWDVWTNQAPLRPYHVQIHRGWARWGDYDGGGRCFGVTGWGTHSYDQIQRALGTDETGPVEVWLVEPVRRQNSGKFDNPKGNPDTGIEYRSLARAVIGPRAAVYMRYANGTELRLDLDADWGPGLGAIFIGTQGKIEINRNKIASNPRELTDHPDNPGPNRKPETQYHIENWIDCIRTRDRCTADIEYGQRSTTLCYLVNIVRAVGQVGRKLRWDPVAERFTNCDEANRLLDRERRAGYELPS